MESQVALTQEQMLYGRASYETDMQVTSKTNTQTSIPTKTEWDPMILVATINTGFSQQRLKYTKGRPNDITTVNPAFHDFGRPERDPYGRSETVQMHRQEPDPA
jgi:hypothetical protein